MLEHNSKITMRPPLGREKWLQKPIPKLAKHELGLTFGRFRRAERRQSLRNCSGENVWSDVGIDSKCLPISPLRLPVKESLSASALGLKLPPPPPPTPHTRSPPSQDSREPSNRGPRPTTPAATSPWWTRASSSWRRPATNSWGGEPGRPGPRARCRCSCGRVPLAFAARPGAWAPL